MIINVPYIPEFKMHIRCKGLCTYSGGKTRLYNYIAYLVYHCKADTFVELFAGSAVLSLNLLQVKHKVICDINLKIAVIAKALSIPDITDNVLCRLKNTVYSREVFEKAHEYWNNNDSKSLEDFKGQDLCDAAYYSWILHTFSRIGSKINKEFIDTKEQRNDFMRFQKNLINYYGKLDNAHVLNDSALDILQKLVDNPDKIPNNTIIYLDPPYLPSKKRNKNSNSTYNCGKFGEEEHRKMLELADKLPRDKCKVIISGYDDVFGLYDSILSGSNFQWSKVFLRELAVMSGDGSKLKDNKRDREEEYVFINFQL